jgi:hypothetical protein
VNSLEARVFELEKAMRNAQQAIRDLNAAVAQAQQQIYATGEGQGGGGGGGGAFICVSAAGTPGGGTTTETIQQFAGGSFTTVGTGPVTNPMPADAIVAGHTVTLATDGNGNYMALSQSCT